tara:strand:- start:1005 stop:2198 length:1194 start_codon:yes stop_codon:yes gene_type:complete
MIETALYSFASNSTKSEISPKAFFGFNNESDFALSWITSVKSAKLHFKNVVLVTDTWAWDNIFSKLDLPFDEVKLTLDSIDENTNMWAISKAHAILEMNEPFLHIDSDVYIWEALDKKYLMSNLLVQSNESSESDIQSDFYYSLYEIHNLYFKGINTYLDNSNLIERDIYAYNCGVVGGTDVEFLRKWAGQMIETANVIDTIIPSIDELEFNPSDVMVWVEQTLLMLMAEHHMVDVSELVEIGVEQSYYTHFCGNVKRDVNLMKALNVKSSTLFGEMKLPIDGFGISTGGVVKPIPTNDIPTYDIPTYDPQTGDLNPHHKELTGKENPMGEYNKVGILKEKNDIMLKRYNESKKIPNLYLDSYLQKTIWKTFWRYESWKHLVNKIINLIKSYGKSRK